MSRIKSVIAAALAATVIGGTAAKADITIGVAGPMTGSEAVFGEQFRHGADKAVADINAKGGVLGQKLQVMYGDDACDPKQAVSVANDFVGQKGALRRRTLSVRARRSPRPTSMPNPTSFRFPRARPIPNSPIAA